MGDNLGHQHEDPVFKRNTTLKEKIKTIKKRNKKFDLWGWKMPGTIHYINDVLPYVRNPYFLVIYRNPLSIAKSSSERSGKYFEVKLLNVVTNHYRKMQKFLAASEFPCLLISFESALINKNLLIKKIGDFCGVKLTENIMEECLKFIDPEKGYQKIFNRNQESKR